MDRLKIDVPEDVFKELEDNYSGQNIGEHKSVHLVEYDGGYYVCTGCSGLRGDMNIWGADAVPLHKWNNPEEPVEYPTQIKPYSYYGMKIKTKFGIFVLLNDFEFRKVILQPRLF